MSGIGTGRFRRRLAVAFVLVGAISATLVATTSYLFLREDQQQDFVDRAYHEAELARTFVERSLEDPSDADALSAVTNRFVRLGQLDPDRFNVLLASDTAAEATHPTIDLGDVPEPLLDAGESFEAEDGELFGEESLVLGSSVSGVRLYVFFSKATLQASTRDLVKTLARDWILVVVIATLVGYLLARRTLQPVARGSEAAQALAEGLLDTRLPVEREDEFGAWAVSFNEMAGALQEKIEALSRAHQVEQRFTSDVSHELRTPLSGVVSAASILREHLDAMDPAARWPAERMIREVGRLRKLVEELLEISRLDAGREEIVKEPVNVGEFAYRTASSFDPPPLVEVASKHPTIETDGRRLERILTNLLANAVEHGGRSVRVTVGEQGEWLTITVEDDGPGIAKEDLPHVFDRFFKADPARTGGSGLGLAIASQNAQLLGGEISVESEPGGGARFVVTIPALRAPQEATG